MKFMSFEKTHKGITLHITIIVLFAVFCVLVAVNFTSIANTIAKIADVLMPLISGIIISLVLFPIQNITEKFVRHLYLKIQVKKRNFKIKLKNNKKTYSPGRAARVISIVVSFLTVIAVLVLFVLVIIPQISKSYNELQLKAQKYLEIAREFIDFHSSSEGLVTNSTASAIISEILKSALNVFYDLFSDITPYIVSVAKRFVNATTDILLGIVIAFYLLLDRERFFGIFSRSAKAILPQKFIKTITEEKEFIIDIFNQYIIGKMIGILISWTLCFAALLLVGVQYAPLISIILAIFNVIPYIGIFIGALPGIFIILITAPDKIIPFVVVVFLVHLVDNKLIERYILKTSTKLDSELLIISMVLFSGFLGFGSMFLAAPVATIIYHFAKRYIEQMLKDKSLPITTSGWLDGSQ